MSDALEQEARVQVLHLQPGDTLVYSVPNFISAETRERLVAHLHQRFSGHPVVVLDGGAELSVISHDDRIGYLCQQVDHLTRTMGTLVHALADDEKEDPQPPGQDLEGRTLGVARDQSQPL